MKNGDLLIGNDTMRRTNPAILEDMGIMELSAIVFKDEPPNLDAFTNVLQCPMTSKIDILERQQILKDFISYPGLANACLTICLKAKECKMHIPRNSYKTIMPQDKYREYARVNNELLDLRVDLYELLRGKKFASGHMRTMAEQLSRNELYNKLRETLSGAGEYIKSGHLCLHMSCGSGIHIREAGLCKNSAPVCSQKKGIFPKLNEAFALNEDNAVYFGGRSMIQYTADEIRSGAILNLCAVLSHINRTVQDFFLQFENSLLFYQAAMKILQFMKRNNLAFCFPEIHDDNGTDIEAQGLYDLSFAAYLKQKDDKTEVIGNNFICKSGGIFLITGPNQGGKTTFIRSVGIAQLMAQGGLPVPAKQYACRVYPAIVTHFPKEEDKKMQYGKLAEELTRLREDIPLLSGGGLALFNESFATTTSREGAQIAKDVLRVLSRAGATVLFVTHLIELAGHIDELKKVLAPGSHAVSLIADCIPDGNHAVRTYKIIPGKPQERVFAGDVMGL